MKFCNYNSYVREFLYYMEIFLMDNFCNDLQSSFQLYDCKISPCRNTITTVDGEKHIEPKAMRVLLLLASFPNTVISRDYFLNQVWLNTCSGDESLTRSISQLRASLRDIKTPRKFIETIPKTGYRLIAPVKHLSISEDDEADNKRRWIPVRIIRGLVLFTIAIFIAVAGYKYRTIDEETTEIIPSIAVLPFINMSSDPGQEYFSDGISEEIRNLLSKIPKSLVISHSSAFKGKDINVSEFAKKLGVSNILKGSVQKSGTKLRITAQLIDVETDTNLWSEIYDRELTDIFATQDEISATIVEALIETLGIELVKTASTAQTIRPEAYDYYLQGLRGLHANTFNSLANAVISFELSIKKAPDFLLARIKLAEVFRMQIWTGSRFDREILDTADDIINQVLVIDPESAEAYYVRARIADNKGELDLAKQYAKEAYRLNPNNADTISTYARLNGYDIGEENARALFNRAQQIDPLNEHAHFHYGLYLLRTLQAYTDAEKAFTQAIKINPKYINSLFFLGFIYSDYVGNIVDAIKQMELVSKLDINDPDVPRNLSVYYLSLGDAQKSLEYANKSIALNVHNGDAIDAKVNVLIFMGQTDKALQLVKDSLDSADTVYRNVSKSGFTTSAIYLLLKGNKLAEAEGLINQHFPQIRNLIDAPLPKSVNEIVNRRGISLLSTVYHAQGKTDKAQKLAERLNLVDEVTHSEGQVRLMGSQYIGLARISAVQNNTDKAIIYLEAAIDNGYLADWRTKISHSPHFLSLQQHIRFIALIKRLEAEMVRQSALVEKGSTSG
jgi:TolB-like protein/DNA-binding winged helix-turn-helix (wHTH) protein/Flp pilus assembly protein TadD